YRVGLSAVADPGYRHSPARLLKPRILIGSVIDHQLCDDPQISRVRRVKKRAEVIERAEIWIDVEVIGDVVSVVSQRRRIKRQKPDCSDAEFLKIIQFLDQSAEVAHPVAVAIAKRFDVHLVDHCIFVPQRIHAPLSLSLRHAFNLSRTKAGTQSSVEQLLSANHAFYNSRFETGGRSCPYSLRDGMASPRADCADRAIATF